MKFDVAHDLLKMMHERNVHLVPQYGEVIQRVSAEGFSYCTPAMLGMTQTLFNNKLMIAHNLLQNAIDEAKGAARVNIVAEKYADLELREKMKRHVGDELRHSKMFADAIAFTDFQSEKEEEGSVQETVDQVFEFDDDLVTFLCRVHSIEVRSWTMLRLYIEMLQEQKDEGLQEIVPILKQIMSDEMYHVQYTGAQINTWLDENTADHNTLLKCFRHTNQETWHDLANMSNYLADHYARMNVQFNTVTPLAA